MSESRGPLVGLTVVDCSTVLAGPYCTMLLADLGADVIKVEPPDGDATRGWGPPWVGAEAGARTAAYYLAVNRNKRSIRLDLHHAEGIHVLRRLIERADVLVENFRPGAFAALGFSESELSGLNDRLVHLAISGYGPDGPDAGRAGYDFVIQASAGLMSITGFGDAAGGEPTKVGVAISDVATGLFGAVAVLAALVGARTARPSISEDSATVGAEATGAGQRIDVSIFESTLAVLVNQAQNAFVSGHAPGRLGNAHPNIVPYETFATADGEIAVAVGSEKQWLALCGVLGRGELANDSQFATNGDRVEHRADLRPILAAAFGARARDELLRALDAAGIPAGPINDVVAAFESPQATARQMRVPMHHPVLGRVDQVGLPFALSGTPASIRTPPPLLGEHADEILDELGYGEADVARLRNSGVI